MRSAILAQRTRRVQNSSEFSDLPGKLYGTENKETTSSASALRDFEWLYQIHCFPNDKPSVKNIGGIPRNADFVLLS